MSLISCETFQIVASPTSVCCSLLQELLPYDYDLESIIDDWVLMGFLVGNDFIPHLPDLHIATSALPFLYRTYMQVMPALDGYLNEGGVINLKRFQAFLEGIASVSYL